jgi:hypothetical protein
LITENLSTLKIHKLTQAQYERELEAGNVDANALYLTTDEAVSLRNLLANENIILYAHQYGDELPAAGTVGRVFFKKA